MKNSISSLKFYTKISETILYLSKTTLYEANFTNYILNAKSFWKSTIGCTIG